ncbi:PD40 domain-containing protein [Herpetosiphon llansteffanensis]|uniref:PD40 domain-containing protein n=1 Tax=Herpetosiphon llansteffanensis TaxID=2094568 RepID=UPI000D7C1E9E|nr:PD40 domain-containing protein [Herpetosiphon llansteffanensis]
MHPLKLLIGLSLIVLALIRCEVAKTTILPYTPQPLNKPTENLGDYSGLAWIDQGLVVLATKSGAPSRYRLFWLTSDRKLGDLVAIPDAIDADITLHRLPDRLPDGRLGFKYSTDMQVINGPPTDQHGYSAFDPDTNTLSELIPRPAPRKILHKGRVVWNPSMDRALVTDGQYLGSKYYWWTASDGFQPLDLEVDVAQYFAWSPDGTTIAFFGLPDAGSGVVSALTRPENLYLMDAEAGNRRVVLADVYNIAGLQWSPDGQWLVFVANFDRSSDQVWLFKTATGERLALTPPGHYQWPAWSPDGKQIAVIWYDPGNTGDDDKDAVIVLDVPDLVRR